MKIEIQFLQRTCFLVPSPSYKDLQTYWCVCLQGALSMFSNSCWQLSDLE